MICFYLYVSIKHCVHFLYELYSDKMADVFWMCYLLILTTADGTPVLNKNGGFRTYIGATPNLVQRIRKHNKITTGGAKITSIGIGSTEDNNRVWRPVCHISGIDGLTEKQALQLEHACKSKHVKSRRKCLSLELRQHLSSHIVSSPALLGIFEAVHMERWTSNAPIAMNKPLRIHWWIEHMLPEVLKADPSSSTHQSLLPSYVTSHILSLDEKESLMMLGSRAKPWKIIPYC